MNKKLMLLGFCIMGAFGTVQADNAPTPPVDADTTVAAQEEPGSGASEESTIASTTTSNTKPTDGKGKKGCGCGG